MGMAKYADITPFYEWLEAIMKEDKKSYPDHNTLMFYEIIDELDSLSEVVLCKNCANHDTISCSDGMVWCKTMCRYMKEDGFCSLGKRKEN